MTAVILLWEIHAGFAALKESQTHTNLLLAKIEQSIALLRSDLAAARATLIA